jgi:site-specific DNA recombinase
LWRGDAIGLSSRSSWASAVAASFVTVKALTRRRQWYEWIVSGEVSGRRSIAQKLGLNERYVGRVLECAFLAPDIVEAILEGRQPPDLTFKKLTHRVPLGWIEQRWQLGFHPPQSRQ